MERNYGDIPVRQLGRTGLKASIIGIGGGHFCRKTNTEQDSIRLAESAIDEGISFIDTAWDYHNGESERRLGVALRGRRDKVVLMTKVCGRDKTTAEQHLHDSLTRLGTDVIDIWQFHEINYDNDAEWIFGPGGAIEAAIAAQDAGKIRYIGFTGHKAPDILHSMLARDFDWDTCQMPVNILDFHFRSFQNKVLPELNRRGIAALGMKSLGGDGQLIKGARLTAQECRRYALSQPIDTLICGIQSMDDLKQDLEIARNFVPMTQQEQDQLLQRVRAVATDGRYEVFKTTQYYDSAYHREQHSFPPIGHVGDKRV